MDMKIFNKLALKFERSDWALDPEFGLIDTILEHHPEIIELLSPDITSGINTGQFGRKDTPTVEQIVRAAIFKEMKGLNYRELEYFQSDSRICATFIKLEERKPFSFQVLQKYISKIRPGSLQKLMVAINKIAISEGLEDVERLRQDSTVVKANIHYPTNNALVWDCIKESHRLLKQLKEECDDLSYRDYTKSAKKTYFKINVTKSKDRRVELFKKQLITFTKCINQVSNSLKKIVDSPKGIVLQFVLEDLLPLMEQVYSMTYRKELLDEVVPNDEKLFSIYERHTDIIVKGSREVDFGHKVNLAGGR
ncbi:MAG: ISNCY family transposase, partial [bacterium]